MSIWLYGATSIVHTLIIWTLGSPQSVHACVDAYVNRVASISRTLGYPKVFAGWVPASLGNRANMI